MTFHQVKFHLRILVIQNLQYTKEIEWQTQRTRPSVDSTGSSGTLLVGPDRARQAVSYPIGTRSPLFIRRRKGYAL